MPSIDHTYFDSLILFLFHIFIFVSGGAHQDPWPQCRLEDGWPKAPETGRLWARYADHFVAGARVVLNPVCDNRLGRLAVGEVFRRWEGFGFRFLRFRYSGMDAGEILLDIVLDRGGALLRKIDAF